MHVGWGRGAEGASEELGSSFVVEATEAEVGAGVRIDFWGWLLVLVTMGSLICRAAMGVLVIWPRGSGRGL